MNINMLKRAILFLSIITGNVACSDYSDLEESSRYSDPNIQNRFISELENDNVKFRVDRDNSVWYSFSDRHIVTNIKSKILSEEYPPYTVEYKNKDEALDLKRMLDDAGITSKYWNRGSSFFISWNKLQDQKVRRIINNREYIKRGFEKR